MGSRRPEPLCFMLQTSSHASSTVQYIPFSIIHTRKGQDGPGRARYTMPRCRFLEHTRDRRSLVVELPEAASTAYTNPGDSGAVHPQIDWKACEWTPFTATDAC